MIVVLFKLSLDWRKQPREVRIRQPSVKFLVNHNSIRPDLGNVKAIQDMLCPRNISELTWMINKVNSSPASLKTQSP